MDGVAAIALLKRFWYVLPLIAMGAALMITRGTLADVRGDLKAADARVQSLNEANATLSHTIDMVGQQRVDNDAIAAAVAMQLQSNVARETTTRTIIERAAHDDPAIADWGSGAVPDGVRAALRANTDGKPAR